MPNKFRKVLYSNCEFFIAFGHISDQFWPSMFYKIILMKEVYFVRYLRTKNFPKDSKGVLELRTPLFRVADYR